MKSFRYVLLAALVFAVLIPSIVALGGLYCWCNPYYGPPGCISGDCGSGTPCCGCGTVSSSCKCCYEPCSGCMSTGGTGIRYGTAQCVDFP